MTSKEYIVSRLEGIKAVQSTPSESSPKTELAEFIYKTLMNKKFRKYSVNSEYQDHIRSAIELNIKKNEPIKIALVFGGYKLWRLEESPEVDWAELFSLIYYAYWLKPITDNYKPGVWFDFYSDDVIVELIDNVPKKDTEKYSETFKVLLEFLKSYLPTNMNFTLNRVGDQYESNEDFRKDLEEKVKEVKKKIGAELPIGLTKEEIATLELNVRPKPDQDKDPQWKEKIQLIHDAYMLVSKRRPYYRTPDKIVAITKSLPNTIAVGTTKTSVAKFWVGVGALKKVDDGFIETILSPAQLRDAKVNWEPISITGLEGRNFRKLRVSG